MTESVPHFVMPGERDLRSQSPMLPRPAGWHLNDDDLAVIDALHANCIEWLGFAKDAKSAQVVASAMDALEAIASGRTFDFSVEVSASRKRTGEDGLGVVLQISPTEIELSSIEWVWMPAQQVHDHATTVRADLSSRGGFSGEAVDYWLYLGDFATDGDQTALLTFCEEREAF